MSEIPYIHKTKQTAERARNEHRPEVSQQVQLSSLYKAVITSVEEGGTYGVALLGADGSQVRWFTGASAFPAATYAIEDEVWIIYDESAEVPTIFSGAGGSGGECSTCLKNYGMLTE